MNPGRYFIPNYVPNYHIPIRQGLFTRLFGGIRSVNWGGLLNNANKTLNVVNQTIPLIRQAGPMFNNLKNMLRLAKAFGNETNKKNNIENKKEKEQKNLNDNQNTNSSIFYYNWQNK